MSKILRKTMDFSEINQPLFLSSKKFMETEMFCLHINTLINEKDRNHDNVKRLTLFMDAIPDYLGFLPYIDLTGISRLERKKVTGIIDISRNQFKSGPLHLREIKYPGCSNDFIEKILQQDLNLRTLTCSSLSRTHLDRIVNLNSLINLSVEIDFVYFPKILMPNIRNLGVNFCGSYSAKIDKETLEIDLDFFPSIFTLEIGYFKNVYLRNEGLKIKNLTLTCDNFTFDEGSFGQLYYLECGRPGYKMDFLDSLKDTPLRELKINFACRNNIPVFKHLEVLEINNYNSSRDFPDLSDFTSLKKLKVLLHKSEGFKVPKTIETLEITTSGYRGTFDPSKLPRNSCDNLIITVHEKNAGPYIIDHTLFRKKLTIHSSDQAFIINDLPADKKVQIFGSTGLKANKNLQNISVDFSKRCHEDYCYFPFGINFFSEVQYIQTPEFYIVTSGYFSSMIINGTYHPAYFIKLHNCTISSFKGFKDSSIYLDACKIMATRENFEKFNFNVKLLRDCKFLE